MIGANVGSVEVPGTGIIAAGLDEGAAFAFDQIVAGEVQMFVFSGSVQILHQSIPFPEVTFDYTFFPVTGHGHKFFHRWSRCFEGGTAGDKQQRTKCCHYDY